LLSLNWLIIMLTPIFSADDWGWPFSFSFISFH
jgi:hypothetical protein